MVRLRSLGSPKPFVREGSAGILPHLYGYLRAPGHVAKAGPIKTDQDFFIIDAPFPQLLTSADVAAGKDGSGRNGEWEVEALAREIKVIHGVLDVGIFTGPTGPEARRWGVSGGQRPIACYFGMQDGSVIKKAAPPKDWTGWKPFS